LNDYFTNVALTPMNSYYFAELFPVMAGKTTIREDMIFRAERRKKVT